MNQCNVELLQQTMQFIDDHPEQHDQSSFGYQTECGTFACFAGWACMLSGEVTWLMQPGFKGLRTREGRLKRVLTREGLPASAAAQELLGLDDHEAGILFGPHNTREALKLMVKDLVNGDTLLTPKYYADLT